MAEQLILNLPVRTALGREDFFVSPANAAAVAAVEGWVDWPYGKLVLVGEEASGKTHLAHVWAALSSGIILTPKDLPGYRRPEGVNAIVVEDVDHPMSDEEEHALFHLHNDLLAAGGHLLLTARREPSRWPLRLADLKSRVMQAGVQKLAAPDDALLAAVMVKLAADRQMVLEPPVISYTLLRMPRSLAAAHRLIAAIDARSLRDKSRPTKPMIAALLAEGVV